MHQICFLVISITLAPAFEVSSSTFHSDEPAAGGKKSNPQPSSAAKKKTSVSGELDLADPLEPHGCRFCII